MSGGSPAGITRRQFGAMTAGSLVAAASPSAVYGQTSTSPAPGAVLDIADWSYYWYGVERVKLARGTLINGTQMYVEHWIRRWFVTVCDRARSRRIRSGIRLDQHARRPAGMGVTVPRAGLQGLPGRSARSGAEPASSVGARAVRRAGAHLRARCSQSAQLEPITRSGRAAAMPPIRRSRRWRRRWASRWPSTPSR